MTTATASLPPPVPRLNPVVGPTIADLLDQLGGIPASRVRTSPPPGTATTADAVHSKEWYGALCELVDGTLVEKPMGLRESGIARAIIVAIDAYNEPLDLGFIGGEAGTYSVIPDQVRMPDVSFIVWDRMPADYPDNPAPDVSPDLAVEVLSPTNTPREIERKRRNYFAGGTRLIWVFDPPTRTVAVYVPGKDQPSILSDSDMLDGGDVLPGFSLAVRMPFDKALRPNRHIEPTDAGRQPPPSP